MWMELAKTAWRGRAGKSLSCKQVIIFKKKSSAQLIFIQKHSDPACATAVVEGEWEAVGEGEVGQRPQLWPVSGAGVL